jgi:hypothetical protein
VGYFWRIGVMLVSQLSMWADNVTDKDFQGSTLNTS